MCKYSKMSLFILVLLTPLIFYLYYNHNAFGHHFSLSKTAFTQLPGWKKDDQTQTFATFKNSCVEIVTRDPNTAFGSFPESKTNQSWQTICLAANKITHPDKTNTQQFFETWFAPYHVKDNFNPKGFFTGYYLPLLHGSLKKTKQYIYPIYGVPPDLVKVNLGLFNPEFSSRVITGQLKNNALTPYPDRAAIHNGALGKNAPVLAWGDNEVDIFFAQIQGSAIVELPNHQQLLIGYASSNGRAYTAIGKILIANNAIEKQTISMQTIHAWLIQHPEQAPQILNQNASYIFFIARPEGPHGTEQVQLTPQRSIAVDKQYIPLGAPIWLTTEVPVQGSETVLASYKRLLIAQDTGGAIKGMIRGDIFWGAGDEAAFSAGHMKNSGEYWILLPN